MTNPLYRYAGGGTPLPKAGILGDSCQNKNNQPIEICVLYLLDCTVAATDMRIGLPDQRLVPHNIGRIARGFVWERSSTKNPHFPQDAMTRIDVIPRVH
jgi:hypothetical protein